ncbi:Lamin-like protein [Linum perenne]
MEEIRKLGVIRRSSPIALLLLQCYVVMLIMSLLPAHVIAYKNYTVGDSLGWYDISEKPNADYQKWADSHNFSLGDFLVFNTNTNHSVIQTYNLTTYQQCDYDNSQQIDTTQWSSGDPSNTATNPVTVAVPLLKEGPNFFFSGDYDGDQCRSGQRFKIAVAHGKGLPDSLKPPSEQAPAPNSEDVNNEDSAPETTVPADFTHPKGQGPTGSDSDDADSDSDDDKKATASPSKNSGDHVTIVSGSRLMVLLGICYCML